MGKYRSLIKDIFLFAISTFIPKAISFFLVPLYTNCLSTIEYGVADLISTTTSLIIPILTLDVNDGVMRFTIESKKDSRPLKIAIDWIIKSIILIFILLVINDFFGFFPIERYLATFFLLNYIAISFYGVLIAYIRAIDKVGLLSSISIIVSFVTIISNILMLVVFNMGLFGYLFSGFIGYFIADIIICWKIKGTTIILGNKGIDKNLRKKMMKYSAPLVAANISWWINSSSDKYIVTAMCGVKENGIYSIAYKIPTILQMLQSIFSQAWLLSVFREYKEKSGPQYVSNTYEMYYASMSISCAALILLDIPMARFLYANDFFEAWKYVPFLLISVVFISYAGFFESILTLHKKSKIIAITTTIGAIVNIFLNFILINALGVIGAAIATMCGYLIVWITRIKPVMNEYYFKVNWVKQTILCVLLIMQAIALVVYKNYLWCVSFFITIVLLNVRIIMKIINSLKNRTSSLEGK